MRPDLHRFTHRSVHAFPVAPDRMWTELEDFDRYAGWSGWVREFSVRGDGLVAGTILSFAVDPPGPLRAELTVELVRCLPHRAITADVTGDLEGSAGLAFEPHATGTRVTVSWDFAVVRPRLRIAAVTIRPFALWVQPAFAHLTARGFRRHLTAES